MTAVSILLAMLVAMATAMPSDMQMEIASTAEPVTVQVYYESLCGGCKLLFSHDFKTMWDLLGPTGIVAPSLYPYGNAYMAKYKGKEFIVCQHGPLECQGNMLEACIMHYSPKFVDYYPALDCIEAIIEYNRTWQGVLEQCKDNVKVSMETIKSCVNSDLGYKLLVEIGKQTPWNHFYVPWVVVDGTWCDLQVVNLIKTVCAAYKGPKPKECP